MVEEENVKSGQKVWIWSAGHGKACPAVIRKATSAWKCRQCGREIDYLEYRAFHYLESNYCLDCSFETESEADRYGAEHLQGVGKVRVKTAAMQAMLRPKHWGISEDLVIPSGRLAGMEEFIMGWLKDGITVRILPPVDREPFGWIPVEGVKVCQRSERAPLGAKPNEGDDTFPGKSAGL